MGAWVDRGTLELAVMRETWGEPWLVGWTLGPGTALRPWVVGISLAGPWESGLRAPHSSRLQPSFCSHLTPPGPSPASSPLLQALVWGRGEHHGLGISPGWRTGKGFRVLWLTLLSSVDPSVWYWPCHLAWVCAGLECGMSHQGVRGCSFSPEVWGAAQPGLRLVFPSVALEGEAESCPGKVLGHPGPIPSLTPPTDQPLLAQAPQGLSRRERCSGGTLGFRGRG